MFIDVILLEGDAQDALLARLRLRQVPGIRCRVRHLTRLSDLARAVELCRPTAVVMDVLMPEVWGAAAVARVQAVAPWLDVVVLTAFDPPGLAENLEELGVAAHLDKSDAGFDALPRIVGELARRRHGRPCLRLCSAVGA